MDKITTAKYVYTIILLYHSNNMNIEYLTKKWGPGWRTCSPSEYPFKNRSISTTTYDLDFVRSKHLGF